MKQPRYVYAKSVWKNNHPPVAIGEIYNLIWRVPRRSDVEQLRDRAERKRCNALFDRLVRLNGFELGMGIYVSQ